MKNYLFAPFENEEDKMITWNSCKSGIDQGIMIFLGRLESSYDVIISELKAENVVAVADERIIKTLEKEIRVLKAENERLNIALKSYQLENESLQDQLKECVSDYEEIRVEKDALLVANGELLQSNLKLRSK